MTAQPQDASHDRLPISSPSKTANMSIEDNSQPELTDSDFWFSEHLLPQYDLLVRDGVTTHAEAADYRARRASMGLPMKVSELTAQVDPAFRWLRDAGGPDVEHGQRIDYLGVHWQAWAFGGQGSLTAQHRTRDQELELTLENDSSHAQVKWSASLEIAAGVKARRSGTRLTLVGAFQAGLACEFGTAEFSGLCWFEDRDESGEGWVTSADGQALRLTRLRSSSGAEWMWFRDLDLESPDRAVAAMFGSWRLQGFGTSREDAARRGFEAPTRLRQAAIGLLGGDEFRAGRLAGIAEAKACIQSL